MESMFIDMFIQGGPVCFCGGARFPGKGGFSGEGQDGRHAPYRQNVNA